MFRLVRVNMDATEFRLNTLLFICLSSTVVGLTLQQFSIALSPISANFALPWVSPVAIVAMSGFVLFAFYFQRPASANKLFEYVLVATLLISFGIECAIAIQRHLILQQGLVVYRDEWASIPISIILVLGPIFFAWNLSKKLAATEGQNPSALKAILLPRTKLSRDASALRAFFYTSIVPVATFAIQLMRYFGIVDWSLSTVISCWILLLNVASFALIYLNYIPQHSSFRSRLVGASLTAILMILCGIAWLVGPIYVESYRDAQAPQNETTIRFEPKPDGSYTMNKTAYQFDTNIGDKLTDLTKPIAMPFDFNFYGKSYTSLYAHNWGMVGFEHMPNPQNIQFNYGPQAAIFLLVAELGLEENLEPIPSSGIFVKSLPDSILITWNQFKPRQDPAHDYTFQLKLNQSGTIILNFATLPNPILPDIFRPETTPTITGIVPPLQGRSISITNHDDASNFTGAPMSGIVSAHQLRFNQHLNQIFAPVAYFILASSLIVLLVFPWIFSINLNRPLQELLFGVRQILNGKLNTKIDVQYRDEIGFLASSFNEMAKAQYELVQSLEQKVIQRTEEAADLAAKNARLEERNHMSRELHDAVSQSLFSANLYADTLPNLWRTNTDKAQIATQEVRRLNSEALAEIRQLLMNYRDETPTNIAFSHQLKSTVEGVQSRFNITVEVKVDGDTTLPENVQLAFLRIVQECLTNAAKHAHAQKFHVYFDGMKSQALVSIRDDGDGFDDRNIPPGRLGLQIMKERIAMIEGTLEIESKYGAGTTITAIWMDQT